MINKQIRFNDHWQFAKSSLDVDHYDGLSFQNVDIPHDWLIYQTTDLYENSIGWYRKNFTVHTLEMDYILAFDGVYMDSTVYVNGYFIGEWKYGYSFFEHNITKALSLGENEIVVKVIHQSPNSRWYSGAGIYRNVYLKERSNNYITTDGVYIHIERDNHMWEVTVETTMQLENKLNLKHQIFYNGEQINSTIDEVHQEYSEQKMQVIDPFLWSPDDPNLYTLVTTLYNDNQCIDKVSQHIGFREIVLDPNKGFILNGKSMKLNGVCEHHDLGALGSAFNPYAWKRRLKILKDMGVNAIRTAHNMPSKEVMELADSEGFLIISEAFDMWERSKTPYDYARFFKVWAYQDVRSWVKRDRNHPSLLLWSIGNEIYDTHVDERGQEITRQLVQYVREFDPKGNAHITIGSNYMPWENAQKCADIVKVAGYNYAEKYYQEHHKKYPDWIIYGSETASTVQSRGIYHFPYNQPILVDDDEQCSSLGNSSTSWGAESTESCIIADRDTPFSIGTFIWTGFDYIGEPTPYHTKNAYLGQIDTATFPKDAYYIYQAAWTDYKKSPMVHIFPYWDFNEGQAIDIRVCSNAPKVEVYINNQLLDTFYPDLKEGDGLTGWWTVPYVKGEIKAIAYDENNELIAKQLRKSFGDSSTIHLQTDKFYLEANGQDLAFLTITMKDAYGNQVENATNRVEVSVVGEGRLIGLDNGDATDYDHYKGTSKRLFSGKLMAIIATTKKAGDIIVNVSSNGLSQASVTLQSIESKQDKTGVSAIERNQSLDVVTGRKNEVPVRKIELSCYETRTLTPNVPQISVQASIYPLNATYEEIEWAIVNDVGIPSTLATIEQLGTEATIIAKGDGAFRVRCVTRNGTDKIKLISELEFQVEGFGSQSKNPYSFVYAGLYDAGIGEIGNGNEKGIATSRDGQTIVGYKQLDFGLFGAEQITIPIFALTNNQYEIDIWDGYPNKENSKRLVNGIYQKQSIWNVYQEETFTFHEKVTGITDIYFVFRDKVHMKGFYCKQMNHATDQLDAKSYATIYGDSYEVTEKGIERIGNNVTITYDAISFDGCEINQLSLYGSCSIHNTVHILLENEKEARKEILEMEPSSEPTLYSFNISPMYNECKISFIFLPGSQFDLYWFTFDEAGT
ncbi:glycoside hydrolase family 2 TIM barrel-domain containing protein [Gracilibacillus marinus]|uniref:Glycoside hydrolase family 2 TIM barrel-domain containing protein n=1 Tax=Gracilibacillus marinus TaxID=630535 RepID=A0ABV8VYP6_9BACI